LRHVGVDCTQIPTGTPLQDNRLGQSPTSGTPRFLTDANAAVTIGTAFTSVHSQHQGSVGSSLAVIEAADISLLALNATGEQKYLGPSSGAFFASYATELLRSCAAGQDSRRRGSRGARVGDSPPNSRDEQCVLQPETVKLLQQSYEMWVHPLYLVLSIKMLNNITAECAEVQDAPLADCVRYPERATRMTIFYLVMALGATNHSNTVRQLRRDSGSENLTSRAVNPPSPTYLYSMALRYFDILAKSLHPSVSFIQILLLVCIYSSYGPTGSSQWQISGLAMRVDYTTVPYL
jgi:hypothetical protein